LIGSPAEVPRGSALHGGAGLPNVNLLKNIDISFRINLVLTHPDAPRFAAGTEGEKRIAATRARVSKTSPSGGPGAHARCHRRVKYISKYIYQKGENKVKQ
jgi:hypothetical protein